MFSMSSKTKRRKSSAGKTVLIFFIVFMILEMIFVVGLSLLFKNKDSTPGIAGYHFYVMKSDKMGDVVPKGSLVVASNGTPSKDKINSAILCTDVEGIGTSVFWLDSIESKEGQDGVEYTIFQKNDPDTKYKIKSSNIVGIANTYYKTAGKIISFITSTIGMVICIAIPLFLLILIELIIAIVKHSSAMSMTMITMMSMMTTSITTMSTMTSMTTVTTAMRTTTTTDREETEKTDTMTSL